MPTLYELTADMIRLMEALDAQEDGEIIDDVALESWMSTLQVSVELKVESICCVLKEFAYRAEARKQEADRLRKLADADESKVRQLKMRLLEFFRVTGTKKVDTEHFRVSVQANGGKLGLVVPANVEELTAAYIRLEPHADVEAIRAALDAGKVVPGCRLLEMGHHVRIA